MSKPRIFPGVPSTSRVQEGVIENQRVEIYSDHTSILDTIKSTHIQELNRTVIITLTYTE